MPNIFSIQQALPVSHSSVQVWCSVGFHFLPFLTAYIPWQRDKYVLDAGANIGMASLQFAPFIHYQGKVRSHRLVLVNASDKDTPAQLL